MPSDSLTSQGRGGYLHNLDLLIKKKTFHRIGFENADNEDCNLVDNRKGSEYLGAREDEETES